MISEVLAKMIKHTFRTPHAPPPPPPPPHTHTPPTPWHSPFLPLHLLSISVNNHNFYSQLRYLLQEIIHHIGNLKGGRYYDDDDDDDDDDEDDDER